jgi:hypothetical protein
MDGGLVLQEKIMINQFRQMLEFKPDYSKCIDERKELHHNLCKNLKKNDIMICNLKNKPCEPWEGYKHEHRML